MGRDEDLALWKQGYEAFANGDLETLDGIMADDVKWHVGGKSSISRTYSGKEEVFGFFGTIVEGTGGTFRIDIHDLLVSDDHVVALVKTSGEREGRSLTANVVHVGHIADGRLAEFWALNEDDDAQAEFWDG